jgi:hypothetical protein
VIGAYIAKGVQSLIFTFSVNLSGRFTSHRSFKRIVCRIDAVWCDLLMA